MAGEEAQVRRAGTNWFYRALNNNESNYEITPRERDCKFSVVLRQCEAGNL